MRTMLVRYPTIIGRVVMLTAPLHPALTEIKLVATRSVTIQATGPRPVENVRHYFNVEGASKERYASYGVLAFELPKGSDRAGASRN